MKQQQTKSEFETIYEDEYTASNAQSDLTPSNPSKISNSNTNNGNSKVINGVPLDDLKQKLEDPNFNK